LFQKYQEEGDAFLPALIRLLESGGSRSLDELLSQVGLDIHHADFWENGFKVLGGLIEELKSLKP
jgi:oligoendopeptidase F